MMRASVVRQQHAVRHTVWTCERNSKNFVNGKITLTHVCMLLPHDTRAHHHKSCRCVISCKKGVIPRCLGMTHDVILFMPAPCTGHGVMTHHVEIMSKSRVVIGRKYYFMPEWLARHTRQIEPCRRCSASVTRITPHDSSIISCQPALFHT